MSDIKIGVVAERTGASVPTIRYYEQIGLLPKARRQPGGQRTYGEPDVERLTFIRRCRDFGFGLDDIRNLVSLMQDGDRSCGEVRDIASAHLNSIVRQMRELRELQKSIAAFVASCDSACAGGAGPDCVVLHDLAKSA